MSKTMARYRVLVSSTMLGCAVSANAQDHSALQQRTPNTLTAAPASCETAHDVLLNKAGNHLAETGKPLQCLVFRKLKAVALGDNYIPTTGQFRACDFRLWYLLSRASATQ